MKCKRTAALLLGVLVLCAALLPMSASAEAAGTWSAEDFTFQVPEELRYRFDIGTPADDPGWTMVGVADPYTRMKDYQDLNILADFYSADGSINIVVMKKETSDSKSIFSLKLLSQEELDQFLDKLGTPDPDNQNFVFGRSFVTIDGQPFFRWLMEDTTPDNEVSDMTCGTIVNGYAFTIEMYRAGSQITEEQAAVFDKLVNSAKITNVLEKPEPQPIDILPTVLVLIALTATVVIPLIFIPIRNRRDARAKKEMADRLSEYRKTHPKDMDYGAALFVNATDCTREAVHTFSIYQAYLKGLVSLIFGGAVCVVVLVASFLLDMEWWLKLLSVGVTVYFGYKAFNMGSAVEKVQKKVFQRGTSATARYSFYQDAFRVSGIQAGSLYPYFQILEVKRHDHYLYLYYGPENAYLIDQYGFELGTFEEFEKFIREKAGK